MDKKEKKPIIEETVIYKFEFNKFETTTIIDALMELPAKIAWNILKKMEDAMMEQSKEEKK